MSSRTDTSSIGLRTAQESRLNFPGAGLKAILTALSARDETRPLHCNDGDPEPDPTPRCESVPIPGRRRVDPICARERARFSTAGAPHSPRWIDTAMRLKRCKGRPGRLEITSPLLLRYVPPRRSVIGRDSESRRHRRVWLGTTRAETQAVQGASQR